MRDRKRRSTLPRNRLRVRCGLRPLLGLVSLFLLASSARAQDRFEYDGVPLSRVIDDIEARTGYRFLYRDALVSGRTLSLEAIGDGVLGALDAAVERLGLDLVVDAARRQVLLFEARPAAPSTARVSGVVLDTETRTRLPHATVSWITGSRLRGAVTDDAGTFVLHLDTNAGPVEVTASFLGYESASVRVDPGAIPGELALGLNPKPIQASEVLVRGSRMQTDLDTAWHWLMQPGHLAPLGEAGVLRSLQALPSVSVTPALSAGLTVRGSRSDGFQVLLDDLPVYGRSHVFGLFDAFNEDAIQAVGFFYGVTPVRYQGPPGGTVAFRTRPGSRAGLGGTFSMSNTSVRGTLEGPLFARRGSWLMSGRRSILSSLDWFGNPGLVELGLDLDRPISDPELGEPLPSGGLQDIVDPATHYFDLHSKVVLESRRGDRFTLTSYVGGDDAGYDAVRVLRLSTDTGQGQGSGGVQVVRLPAGTDQRWGSVAAGASWRGVTGPSIVSTVTAGYSRFFGEYQRDDAVYPDSLEREGPGNSGRVKWSIGTFANRTSLDVWLAQGQLSGSLPEGASWTAGVELNAYDNTYRESGVARPEFHDARRSVQVDGYAGFATSASARVGTEAGIRLHYFGLGRHVGLSPRLDLRLTAGDHLRFMLGASRNYQFLYSISLEHEPTVEIWTTVGPDEKPTVVDFGTLGIHARVLGRVFLQTEAWVKRYENLRLHELTARPRLTAPSEPVIDPWLWDARGNAAGLEMSARFNLGPAEFVQTYTWSRVRLSHPRLNGGTSFPAWWDRTHQGSLSVRVALGGAWQASAAWILSTGVPNTLAALEAGELARLPGYGRLDLAVEGRFGTRFDVRAGLYNATDRDNVWYRRPVPVVVDRQQPGRITQTGIVSVYDLGMQPSVDITVRF